MEIGGFDSVGLKAAPDDVTKVLGASIGQARSARGLTQQQLCAATNLSYSTLAKIERGAIKSPNIFTVVTIAQALGLSVEELVGVSGPRSDAKTGSPVRNLKQSKSGVKFVYFDINGVMVRFFHHAFSELAQDTGASAATIENTFWHYNDAVCRGEMSLEEFNRAMANHVKQDSLDWTDYYLKAIDPIEEVRECIEWVSKNYKFGLMSNIMPGFIDKMICSGLLPDLNYDVIIDSSEVGAIKPEARIYEIATTKSGVLGNEILLIDDSRTNLMSAERMDWQVLWFDDYQPAESTARIRDALEFEA